MDVRQLRRLNHLLMRRAEAAIGDVVEDGVVEEDRVLRNHSNGAAEGVQREASHIVAVDADRAGLRVVQAVHEASDRALPAAAGANNCDCLAWGHRERHVVEDGPVWGIRERHILKLHGRAARTARGDKGYRIQRILDGGLLVEEGEHGLHVNQRLAYLAVHRAQKVEGQRQLEQQAVHHHQVTQRHRTFQDAMTGHDHRRCKGRAENEILPKVEQRQTRRHLHRRRLVLSLRLIIPLCFMRLIVEVLDSLVVDERVHNFCARLCLCLVHRLAKVRPPGGGDKSECSISGEGAQCHGCVIGAELYAEDSAGQSDLKDGWNNVEHHRG
mmetsp:Transcript_21144/g.36292  ORF Transcript_21144/g.36292 Transcript_21144/m.36292 type:complete len:327 (-) Transcript_21144:639-1619(-)